MSARKDRFAQRLRTINTVAVIANAMLEAKMRQILVPMAHESGHIRGIVRSGHGDMAITSDSLRVANQMIKIAQAVKAHLQASATRSAPVLGFDKVQGICGKIPRHTATCENFHSFQHRKSLTQKQARTIIQN